MSQPQVHVKIRTRRCNLTGIGPDGEIIDGGRAFYVRILICRESDGRPIQEYGELADFVDADAALAEAVDLAAEIVEAGTMDGLTIGRATVFDLQDREYRTFAPATDGPNP